jgi:hypothetical protein
VFRFLQRVALPHILQQRIMVPSQIVNDEHANGKASLCGSMLRRLASFTPSILSPASQPHIKSTLRYSCMSSAWGHHMYPDVCHDLECRVWPCRPRLPATTLPHSEGRGLARPSQGKCQQTRQPLTMTARKSATRAFRGAVGPSDSTLRANCLSTHIVSFAHEHHAISTPYRCRR